MRNSGIELRRLAINFRTTLDFASNTCTIFLMLADFENILLQSKDAL